MNRLIEMTIESRGFSALRPMQSDFIDAASTSKDVLLKSPTGSGKTLAFLLSMVSKIQTSPEQTGLVIAPTRELAIQVHQELKLIPVEIHSCLCYGGHDRKVERNRLSQDPKIVIGTPGRLADHLRSGYLNIGLTTCLVIDEYDKIMDLGFEVELSELMSDLSSSTQVLLTSATTSDISLEALSTREFTELNYAGTTSGQLSMKLVRCDHEEKPNLLVNLIKHTHPGRTIVFFNHREAVERMSIILDDAGLPHSIFHGGLYQEKREQSITKLKHESTNILLSTDLAARGIDVQGLEHIVHYQLPIDEASFTHRNGRTARMEAEGTSWFILQEDQTQPEYTNDFEEVLISKNRDSLPNPKWMSIYVGAGKRQKISKKDLVGFFIHQGGLSFPEVGKIDVFDRYSVVSINRETVISTLQNLRGKKIKKVKPKVSRLW